MAFDARNIVKCLADFGVLHNLVKNIT